MAVNFSFIKSQKGKDLLVINFWCPKKLTCEARDIYTVYSWSTLHEEQQYIGLNPILWPSISKVLPFSFT